MGYSGKVFSAFSWQTALKLAPIVVSFSRIFFLARLLTPDDFGLYAIVMIALGLPESTTETGINVTIIQATEKSSIFLDTAWVIAIFRWSHFCIDARRYWWFRIPYHQPTLILICFSRHLLIKASSTSLLEHHRKTFDLPHTSVDSVSRFVIGAILAVAFVFLLPGVWSLLWALVVAAMFEVLSLSRFISLRPKFRFSWGPAKNFGHTMPKRSLSRLHSYIVENADDLIIGKSLGTYTLGVYHNGYALTITHLWYCQVCQLRSLSSIFKTKTIPNVSVEQCFFLLLELSRSSSSSPSRCKRFAKPIIFACARW